MVLKQIGTQQWFLIKNYTTIVLILKKCAAMVFLLNCRLHAKIQSCKLTYDLYYSEDT